MRLREKSGSHAGEHVTRAASGHARISGDIHPDASIRDCDQRAMPFQHQHTLVLFRERSRDSDSIGLHLFDGSPGQSRHLTRMRR